MPTLEMLPDKMPRIRKRVLPALMQGSAETAPGKINAESELFWLTGTESVRLSGTPTTNQKNDQELYKSPGSS